MNGVRSRPRKSHSFCREFGHNSKTDCSYLLILCSIKLENYYVQGILHDKLCVINSHIEQLNSLWFEIVKIGNRTSKY